MRNTDTTAVTGSPNPGDSAEAASGFILKLYAMVNGAPDDVIKWTPEGDAFVIGGDLNRLEEETLPQYFRHNRFQSLVRQLNFYSFRKINRERNVWIYKHDLFDREHPENLHLVRRRTCPGMDGRKHRFSRKLSRQSSLVSTSDDDVEDATSSPLVGQKRSVPGYGDAVAPSTKRASIGWSSPYAAAPSSGVFVDTSMVEPLSEMGEPTLRSGECPDDDKHGFDTVSQSAVVSLVSTQLDECARKAMRERGEPTFKRSGVVTPPFRPPDVSSLLTYDDECTDPDERYSAKISSVSSTSRVGSTLSGSRILDANAVIPAEEAEVIIGRLLQSCPRDATLTVPAKVSTFCMSNYPVSDKILSSQIRSFLASCEWAAAEFQLYWTALHPFTSMQSIWESDSLRRDAVRQFTVFAVNSMQHLVGRLEKKAGADLNALGLSANVWQKSL